MESFPAGLTSISGASADAVVAGVFGLVLQENCIKINNGKYVIRYLFITNALKASIKNKNCIARKLHILS
jgi:hypothetical protein